MQPKQVFWTQLGSPPSHQIRQDDEDGESGGEEEHADRVADLLQDAGRGGVLARPEDGRRFAVLGKFYSEGERERA